MLFKKINESIIKSLYVDYYFGLNQENYDGVFINVLCIKGYEGLVIPDFLKNSLQTVFDISVESTHNLIFNDYYVEFTASFNGIPEYIQIPYELIDSIYTIEEEHRAGNSATFSPLAWSHYISGLVYHTLHKSLYDYNVFSDLISFYDEIGIKEKFIKFLEIVAFNHDDCKNYINNVISNEYSDVIEYEDEKYILLVDDFDKLTKYNSINQCYVYKSIYSELDVDRKVDSLESFIEIEYFIKELQLSSLLAQYLLDNIDKYNCDKLQTLVNGIRANASNFTDVGFIIKSILYIYILKYGNPIDKLSDYFAKKKKFHHTTIFNTSNIKKLKFKKSEGDSVKSLKTIYYNPKFYDYFFIKSNNINVVNTIDSYDIGISDNKIFRYIYSRFLFLNVENEIDIFKIKIPKIYTAKVSVH